MSIFLSIDELTFIHYDIFYKQQTYLNLNLKIIIFDDVN